MPSEDDASKARGNSAFRAQRDRHEKGSAMDLIADEAKATENKTARLKAMRLEREAAAPPPEEKKPAPKRKKAVARA